MAEDLISRYEPYSLGLWVFFWIIALLSLPSSILGVIIWFTYKEYFELWAKKIKRDPKTPFIITTLFGLLGLLGYYIFYKIKTREKKC